MNNEFTQNNGMIIKEGKTYTSHVGDLVRVKKIDVKENKLICYNISDSCSSWHRVDSAITDNKFRSEA